MIHYGYLWHAQARRGQLVPSKDRPSLVVAVTSPAEAARSDDGARVVYVMPITTRAPGDPARAIVLPSRAVRRCGLDVDRHPTLVCDEINRFEWRGPDVVATPDGRSHYGEMGETIVRAALDLFGVGERRKITPRSS